MKELFKHNDTEDFRVGNNGEYKTTADAIKFIAFRKCLNTPTPNVYKDASMINYLDTIDIEASFE